MGVWSESGSQWHRWDPHLHAPGTQLADAFGGNWEEYLSKIETSSPRIRALGVTDYFCIGTYRKAREYKSAGRMPEVELLFPNVEIRLDIKTDKVRAINMHLLFSPDDPNHEKEIERLLGQLQFEFNERTYFCTATQLADLGRACNPSVKDEAAAQRFGTNQFKTTLGDLRKLFRNEKWLRNNCLVAVAGSSNDGTSGLQADDSYAATRKEIERFANIIFASTPKQREFWLGKLPSASVEFIEEHYGALKPCLHGSDAHRNDMVGAPDCDRYCWLYGDMAFETLRQAVIEPEHRVAIGPQTPPEPLASEIIRTVTVSDAPWLARSGQEFNSGLVTIIGARGSGKTALMELLAAGAGAFSAVPSESSFLQRASKPVNLLGSAETLLTWGNNATSRIGLNEVVRGYGLDQSYVRYLSQQFVEKLCSSSGLAIELRQEMERVVFDSTPQEERFETDNFDDLAAALLQPITGTRTELQESIHSIGLEIVREEKLRDELPQQEKAFKDTGDAITRIGKELQDLLPKESAEHAKALAELESLCSQAELKIEAIRKRRKLLDDLGVDVRQVRQVREPTRFRDMQTRFVGTGLTPQEWTNFAMRFTGNVDAVLDQATKAVDQAILFAIEGDPRTPINLKAPPNATWPLNSLRTARDVKKKLVGIDAERQKKYDELQKTLQRHEATLRKLEADVTLAKGAAERRKGLLERRRQEYTQAFRTIVEEEDVLRKLYAPLRTTLEGSGGTLAKLGFVVERTVDIDKWVEAGESLMDLRLDSAFRGRGSLGQKARDYLYSAWKTGTPETVDEAMEKFRADLLEQMKAAQPATVDPQERREWPQRVASWLYNISHIQVRYSIVYDGVPVERLSPGTRGIVLLLLYLAVDTHDPRPLLIDQPEENLDPQSVFDELVPHFRNARKRRQVVVVTHNANLVVNTDADQVIIASSTRQAEGGLPLISYEGGSLESPKIRAAVCRLLEGGQRAFLERERHYRLNWGAAETNGE
jgi:energy-coupling factor transporter ATP-binding protein EcfA2